MKTIVINRPANSKYPMATHINEAGEKFQLLELSDDAVVHTTSLIKENTDIAQAEVELGLTKLEIPEHFKPKPPAVRLKSISKFDLINKLVALELADEFATFISNLPTAEKLKWDAAQNISPKYPFIVDNKETILTTLGVTEEQFNSIFK